MPDPLRVLIVEDSEDDTFLIVFALQQAGYEVASRRVETEAEMLTALKPETWDLIIADYVMPGFSGLAALKVLQESGLDLPFILVSGKIGEEAAVAAMHAGAHDYIMKDRLARLAPAIQRELQEAESRRQRRLAEKAFLESRETLRTLIDAHPEAMMLLDTQGRVLAANAMVAQLMGKSMQEILGANFFAFLPPEIAASRKVHFDAVVSAGEPRRFEDTQADRLLDHYLNPIFDPEGRVAKVAVLSRDVTRRRLAEEEVRRGERFLSSILASIQDGISVMDKEYNLLRVNPALERLFPASVPLVGQKCYAAFHQRREPCDICPSRITLATGEPCAKLFSHQHDAGESDNYMEIHTFPLVDPSSGQIQGVVEHVRDISERRCLEEQFLQAQKMEAVGRLAGGVAHDFNNLLGVIMGYSEMMLMDFNPDHPFYSCCEAINKASARGASLTRQLLAFSRKQVLAPKIINLNEVVTDLEKMLPRLLGEDVEIASILHPALAAVKVDPGQMEQVIMNLAVNARDAMDQGGRLTLETANVHLDADYRRRHPHTAPGHYVMLAVSDNGTGMDRETLSRIFEPFFTSKDEGKGTGLGLSTVHGIINQSNGFIEVSSEPGHGTTFKIYLPQAKEELELLAEEDALPASLEGSETILVAEDDGLLRQMACKTLRNQGYTVLDAGLGSEALALAQRYEGTIHLLLTDVVMPQMSGRELVESLRPLRPGLQVLFMSGYTEDAIVHHGVLDPAVNFLPKPFGPRGLARKVREILDRRPQ